MYIVCVCTECVTKIRTNFNLNFPFVLPEVVVDIRKSLMLLVNNRILKMAAKLKLSVEYNRRAAIIEGLHAGRSAMEIIRFFGYPNYYQSFMMLWQNI